MRQSHTAGIERNATWSGAFATEPYEVGWATEAIFYVRTLSASNLPASHVRVQISPDGIHWCDEGATVFIAPEGVTFVRVSHFGAFLRLSGTLPEGAEAKVIVYLSLKA